MHPQSHRRRPAPLAALAAALAAAVLAGCGSSGDGVTSKSASAILAASQLAAQGASSVHVSGESAVAPLKLELDLELSQVGGRGTLSLLGLRFEAIRDGETVYVKGTPAFYSRLGIDPAKVPSGAWVKVPAGAGELGELIDLRGETARLLSNSDAPTKGATTTVDGQPAIELRTAGKLYSGTLYVATTGRPYPLKIERHGRETSHVTFSGWNEPVAVTPPADVVEASTVK